MTYRMHLLWLTTTTDNLRSAGGLLFEPGITKSEQFIRRLKKQMSSVGQQRSRVIIEHRRWRRLKEMSKCQRLQRMLRVASEGGRRLGIDSIRNRLRVIRLFLFFFSVTMIHPCGLCCSEKLLHKHSHDGKELQSASCARQTPVTKLDRKSERASSPPCLLACLLASWVFLFFKSSHMSEKTVKDHRLIKGSFLL
jgi:hypothetical protein